MFDHLRKQHVILDLTMMSDFSEREGVKEVMDYNIWLTKVQEQIKAEEEDIKS